VSSSLALEAIVATCTGFSMPTSIGPMTLSPPSSRSSLAERLADCSPRHDEAVGGAGKAAERVVLHHRGIERHVRRHLALIFEVHTAFVQYRNRLAQIFEPVTPGVAEGGVGQEGDAGLMAHAAGDGRSSLGDVRQLDRGWALVHGGIGLRRRRNPSPPSRRRAGPLPRLGLASGAGRTAPG
jgi:hypothetical protein